MTNSIYRGKGSNRYLLNSSFPKMSRYIFQVNEIRVRNVVGGEEHEIYLYNCKAALLERRQQRKQGDL